MKRETIVFAVFSLLACVHVEQSKIDVDLQAGSLTVDGRERTFVSWEAGPGAPLVISLHGRGGTARGQERLGPVMPIAKRERFTLVLPDGIENSWNDAREYGPSAELKIDDVHFLSMLIDEFVKRGADPHRVYVLGMSNGGFMALTLACKLSDRLAGVASITGAVSTKLSLDCPMKKPLPIVMFMGTDDPLIPFDGGQVAKDRGEMLGIPEGAAFLARKNGCSGDATVVALPDLDVDDGTRVEVRTWAAGCERAPVKLFVIEGGGHTWPGGWQYARERFIGKMSRDLNASEAAWSFFTEPR